jgi:hypothetical protein
LASLVRFTAVNAYRSAIAAGNQQTTQPHPFQSRQEMIQTISTRHQIVTKTFETFMNQLINEKPKPQHQSVSTDQPISIIIE